MLREKSQASVLLKMDVTVCPLDFYYYYYVYYYCTW